MRRIRSKDTRPELLIRRLVFKMGCRYRLHGKNLPGKPDLVFAGRRKVIFVHGCFWHLHKNCPEAHYPKSNAEYWQAKLQKNRARDLANRARLRRQGWSVLTVWECQLKQADKLGKTLGRFLGKPCPKSARGRLAATGKNRGRRPCQGKAK